MDEFSEDDRKALLHQNQPYDESLEVPDAEEIASTYSPTPRVPNPSVKAREALQLNRQDLGHSRGNSPPQSAMSDQSDDPYEDKPSQPSKKKEGSKGGSLRRQTLLSARSQKKAASQEEGGQEAPAPSNQVVTPQAPDATQPLLPQLGPRPPQGMAGPGAGQPAPPGQHPPQQQQQQPSMPQRPQMMPQQQRMAAGMRVPQAPMMPRIPSQQMPPQQQVPQMRAQQQQMTMQQAAMRARAQMYGGQMQMAQMAQMAYMQRMQMMQLAQMGYGMQRHPQPATAPAGGGSEEEEEEEEEEDDEDDSEEDEDSDEEEEEENMDEGEEVAGQAVMEPPQPDAEAGEGEEEAPKPEESEQPPVQQTPPETQVEEESREKKAESQKPKKGGKEKEEKPAEEKDATAVAKPSKKKKSKKPKRSTKHEIPPIRVRGVLRSHTDPGAGLGMPSPFGAPREALPDIAGVKKQPQQPIPASRGAAPQSQQFNSEDDDDDEDDEDDSDDDDDDDEHPQVEGAYDPAEFENLSVTAEIKELFQYITRYTPQSIELDHKLKPFIPDFIPSVGDIDAFIKIPRPDNKPDTLGLTVLDEPCAKQSDPTVLDLQLRAISKQTTAKTLVVKSLESAEKNPKAIENWIESIRDLHRSKPPPNVHYSRNMPDIDTLMQEWPPEFEELLKEVSLPTADLDCDLGQFTEIICSILDIPVYKTSSHQNEKIQALHVLFTLYSEFKNSQHFQALAANNQLDNALKDGAGDQLFL